MKPIIDLYSNKPWVWEKVNLNRVQTEVSYLRNLFHHFGVGDKVLDLGCGLGYHLRELGKYYDVTGVDNDFQVVQNAHQLNPSTKILHGDMKKLEFVEEFDVIICLQSVLSYCLQPKELLDTLSGIKNALKLDGIVMIDVMDVLSLLASGKYASERQTSWGSDSSKVNLITKHTIDTQSQIMVTKRYWTVNGDNEIYYDETASRLFFPQDLKTILMCVGLSIEELPENLTYPSEDRLFLVARNSTAG